MDFKELEKIMAESNVNSLAQIARILDTTPQAVSGIGNQEIRFHFAL